MKKILLLMLLATCFAAVKAQDSLKTSDLRNAYQISRKLMAMERRLSTDTLTNGDRYSIRMLISSLGWYAGMQDYEQESVTDSLSQKLKGKYEKLGSLYQLMVGRLFKVDLLLDEDIQKVNQLLDINANASLKPQVVNELGKYWTAIRARNDTVTKLNTFKGQLNDTTVEYKTTLRYLNTARDKLNGLDSLAKLDTPDVKNRIAGIKKFADDSARLKKDVDSLTEKIRQYGADAEAEAEKVKNIRAGLTNNFLSPTAGSAGRKVLIKLSGLGDDVSFQRSVTIQNEQIAKSQIDYSREKESMAESSVSGTISFRMPSEAEMIDAIAIYLAKRVKQEAVMYFFETVKKNAKQYELIRTFFPNTITLLQSNEVYEIPNLGAQWRYALSKDFVKMPRSLLKSDWFHRWYNSKAGNDPYMPKFLEAVLDVCELLNQQYSYNQLIKEMFLRQQKNNITDVEGRITPLKIFSILYAFNQECFVDFVVKDTLRTRPLSYEDFKTLSRDELELMITLMDMKYGEAFSPIWKRNNPGRFLSDKDAEAFRLWAGSIESGIQQFNKMQEDYIKLENAIREGKKVDAVYTVFNVWDNINTLLAVVIPDSTIGNEKLRKVAIGSRAFKENTEKVFDIYHQLSLKNYAGASNAVIELVEGMLYSDSGGFFLRKSVIDSIATRHFVGNYINRSGDSTRLTQVSLGAAFVFEQDRHAINLIRKLAGFLNDVMLTTDSKKLSKVVESYAMPPGSYKRKRNSWMSLDLNAYVGAYAGMERSRNITNDWGGVYGITAPIGLTLSKTFGRKLGENIKLSYDFVRNPDKLYVGKHNVRRRSATTLSLSVNIVDIGAVVAYRFSNTDSTSKGLPRDVNWSQVISPGVRFGYGIPGTPLVASLGWQYTPKLRSFNNTNEEQYNTHRFSAGVLVDLPLANFWQQSYRKSYYLKPLSEKGKKRKTRKDEERREKDAENKKKEDVNAKP